MTCVLILIESSYENLHDGINFDDSFLKPLNSNIVLLQIDLRLNH